MPTYVSDGRHQADLSQVRDIASRKMQHSTSKATTLLSPSVAEDREELSGSDAQETSAAVSGCRRESIRGSFGGQIHMVVNGRRIKAIIRDASFSNDPNTIGVGILHQQGDSNCGETNQQLC